MKLKANRETIHRSRRLVEHNLLIRNWILQFKFRHHVVHENKYLQPRIFFPRTHSRSSSKWDKSVWCRSATFKSRWIKLLWISEVFRILVCRMNGPKCLQEIEIGYDQLILDKFISISRINSGYIYLPPLWNGETCVSEISYSLSEGSLTWRC